MAATKPTKPNGKNLIPGPEADVKFDVDSTATPVPESNGTGPARKPPKVLANVDYNALMDQVASENLDVLYLQARTRVRFLPLLEGRPPVVSVKTIYNGKTRTKYLMGVWNLTRKEGEENNTAKVQAVLLSKRTVRAVLQYAAEGWDLFSPEEGRGVMLAKTGSGLNTEITLSPSPHSVSVPEEIMEEWYNFDIQTVAADWEKGQLDRAAATASAEGTEDDEAEEEEAPAPRQPAGRKSKQRNESGW